MGDVVDRAFTIALRKEAKGNSRGRGSQGVNLAVADVKPLRRCAKIVKTPVQRCGIGFALVGTVTADDGGKQVSQIECVQNEARWGFWLVCTNTKHVPI